MSIGCLLAILSWTTGNPVDSVYGSVRDGLTRAALADVQVEILNGTSATTTNSEGEYSLATSVPGLQRLRVLGVGYDTLVIEAMVPAGQSLRIDVELDRRPTPLPAIEVIASDDRASFPVDDLVWRDSTEIGLRQYTVAALRSDPLAADADPLLAIAATPGAANGFPSTVHIRGGSSDQNLILIDGVPIYGIMHLGGTASVIDPDAVASVDLHSAAPPANFGGRLSSAIDVRLRLPGTPGFHFNGALDRTAIRQTVEASAAGREVSLLVSARQSYRGVFPGDGGDDQQPNGFQDYLVRAALTRPLDRVDLYVLASADRLEFPAGPLSPSSGAADSGLLNQFVWSNLSAGLVWRHALSGHRLLTTRLWQAGSTAGIIWATPRGLEHLASSLADFGGSVDLLVSNPSSHRQVGMEFRRLRTDYEVATASSSSAPFLVHGAPVVLAAFVSEQRSVGLRLVFSGGVRANYAQRFGLALEARASTRWAITPRLAALLGYGRVHQYLQSMRNEESLIDRAFGPDLPVVAGTGGIHPARSDQISAAIEAAVGRHLKIHVDGYARQFADVAVVPAVTAAPFAVGSVSSGSGQAHGVELEVLHHTDRWDLRGNLGLAGTERQTDTTEFAPGAQRSRWIAVGIGYRLGDLAAVSLASSIASGSPTSVMRGGFDWQSPGALATGGEISGSPQQIVGGLNRSQLPTFLRVDLGVVRDWPIQVMGRGGLLTTTFTVNNLLNRRNALGYLAAPSFQLRRTLFLPSRSFNLQVAWRF